MEAEYYLATYKNKFQFGSCFKEVLQGITLQVFNQTYDNLRIDQDSDIEKFFTYFNAQLKTIEIKILYSKEGNRNVKKQKQEPVSQSEPEQKPESWKCKCGYWWGHPNYRCFKCNATNADQSGSGDAEDSN